MPVVDEQRLNLPMIDTWTPPRVAHCSNCLHCKVSQSEYGLVVSCAQGYDKGVSRPMSVVIRAHNARGFRNARQCPDYTSMSDMGRKRKKGSSK
jgi:hypothetical protein